MKSKFKKFNEKNLLRYNNESSKLSKTNLSLKEGAIYKSAYSTQFRTFPLQRAKTS